MKLMSDDACHCSSIQKRTIIISRCVTRSTYLDNSSIKNGSFMLQTVSFCPHKGCWIRIFILTVLDALNVHNERRKMPFSAPGNKDTRVGSDKTSTGS